MGNFAVIENGVVTNTLLADSLAIAEEVTGKTCVEYTLDNAASIGSSYDSDRNLFLQPSPYPSWTLVDDVWTPPSPRPTDESKVWSWNETDKEWVDVTPDFDPSIKPTPPTE